MRHSFLAAVLCMFLLLWGCGGGEEPRGEIVVEEIDGVTYVHNPAVPLFPEKHLLLEEELTIGGEDTEGNILLFHPSLFLVDGRGAVYISERLDQVFKVFDREGNLVGTIGAKGNGPGEFQSLGFCGFTPDGRLLTTDYMARRTSLFDQKGHFLSDFKWTHFYSRMFLVKESSYLTEEIQSEGQGISDGRLFIKEIDFAGKEIRSYGEFTSPTTQAVRMGSGMFGTTIPFSPMSVFAGDGERGFLYHCLNSDYRIEVFDEVGRLFRVLDRPYARPAYTAEEKRAFRERWKDYPSEDVKKAMQSMELPSVKTVTETMLTDDEGNLWVFTNESKEDDGKKLTAVDLFDPQGRYEARLWLEYKPWVIKGGRMYRLAEEEETGYRTVKRYRMIWN
jgi:hypothetical protein